MMRTYFESEVPFHWVETRRVYGMVIWSILSTGQQFQRSWPSALLEENDREQEPRVLPKGRWVPRTNTGQSRSHTLSLTLGAVNLSSAHWFSSEICLALLLVPSLFPSLSPVDTHDN